MFDNNEPIYLQIAQNIRDQILGGDLPEETQVMSTTQYATTFRINPATAAKAFAELVEEGILYKRRGVGMFVSPGARSKLVQQGQENYFTTILEPALRQACMLGISAESVTAHVTTFFGSAPTNRKGQLR